MTNIRTTVLAGFLAMAATTAFANDGTSVPAPTVTPVIASSNVFVLPVKAPVLLERRAPSRKVVRVIHEPIAIPVAREASMTSVKKFVFTSPKNTSTKTYRPAAPKHASMPNLFKK